LTRLEILYNETKGGILLKDDPFFQLVKDSWTVREMLMAPGEEFSADRIVEKALRQDVGPDPSAAMNKQNYKYEDESSIL
jgi:hypothetical protein